MRQDDFPDPESGFVVTHFLVVADQDLGSQPRPFRGPAHIGPVSRHVGPAQTRRH